jgi:predicted enzyme related to lactoylglutathione lyase
MSDPTPTIEGLSAVSVHVTDIDRSRKFYHDVLGLREVEFQPERQRAVFAIPDSNVLLTMHVMTDPREEGRPPGTVSGILFKHHDPAAAMEEIRRRGGTVTGEVTRTPWGLVRGAFADPDGNEFVLAVQR